LVVGGGITGAGVALDAKSRLRRRSSSATTSLRAQQQELKLVHGGLRYLDQHEFRLVYEALAERQRIIERAPPRVDPAVPRAGVAPGARSTDAWRRSSAVRCGCTTSPAACASVVVTDA
jgi:glycerol-3-phosphate dehydrogenase